MCGYFYSVLRRDTARRRTNGRADRRAIRPRRKLGSKRFLMTTPKWNVDGTGGCGGGTGRGRTAGTAGDQDRCDDTARATVHYQDAVSRRETIRLSQTEVRRGRIDGATT